MRHTKIPLLLSICFTSGLLTEASLQAQTVQLQDAVRLLLEHEPELNAVEYDTLSSIEDITVARSATRPQLSLDSSIGFSSRDRDVDGLFDTGDDLLQRDVGLSLRQLLYDGGSSRNQIRASENSMKAQQYLEKGMIEDRIVDLSEVYMDVLRLNEQLSNAQSNINNHHRFLKLIESKIQHGGVRTEANLVRSRLSSAKKTMASVRHNSENAKARFRRLTGTSNYQFSHPAVPHIPRNLEAVQLSSNWDYQAAAEALESAEYRAKSTGNEMGPKVYLDGGYSIGQDVNGVRGRNNEASALIAVEWDILTGGRRKAIKKRDHFQVGKFEELKRAALLNGQNDLDLLWQERTASYETGQTLREQKRDLTTIVSDYEHQFSLGQVDLISLLDRQSEYHVASSDLINANYDHSTSAFRIYGIQGKLTNWLLQGRGSAKTPIKPQVLAEHRVPRTQDDLMLKAFHERGPSTDYDPAPMKQYYKKETVSRPGIFKEPFFKKNKHRVNHSYNSGSQSVVAKKARTKGFRLLKKNR